MTSWSNTTKNTTTLTNQTRQSGGTSPLWSAMTMMWKTAEGTWELVRTIWDNQTKNTSTFTNQTKN